MDSNYRHISRSLEAYAFDEVLVGRHMVFIAGPRQVGKTRLARRRLAENECESLYFNWDDPATRQSYLKDPRFFESAARSVKNPDPWIVFDEIHKRPRWRDILKGIYDLFGGDFRFLVTGSARLDLFRRSGDALVGRYSLFHMLPLSLSEAAGTPRNTCFLAGKNIGEVAESLERELEGKAGPSGGGALDSLLRYGPFPEPFIQQDERFSRIWHRDYISLLVREELRDISRVVELDKLEHLVMLLPERVSSPLSMANLAQDLEVAHTTVKKWLEQLRRLYLIFPVSPWHKKVSRGLKKEKKWYFLDWTYAPEGGQRQENIAATALYRTCTMLTDMGFGDYSLHYLRTLDRREIDFVVCRDGQPVLCVECKTGGSALAPSLANRKKWFPENTPTAIQTVATPGMLQKHPSRTWVMSLDRLLGLLV
ncbi:MAG: ATP-binding protein [Desulfobacterales bacterium]|nr:ATP-binding protein [Desulfobacterales bacterium]